MLINAQNLLRLPVPLRAQIASTVDLPALNPNCFSERPFSPTKRLWSRCRNKSSRSLPIVSNRHIGLQDEASSRGLLPFLSRANLYFFQSSKNLPSRRQELKASRRMKSSSRRTTQELRSCLWNGSTCGNKLRTKYLTWAGLSRPGVFLLVTNLLVTILEDETPWVFFDFINQVFPALKSASLYSSPQSWFALFHASCSRVSPFDRVNFRRAARHSWRRTANWSFHQYIESPVRPCPRRGIEQSHAAPLSASPPAQCSTTRDNCLF